MADHSDAARARAEARLEKVQKQSQESAAVWAQYEASGRAIRAKTASLREERLVKEAAEAEALVAAAALKAQAKKKRKPALKT